MDNLEMANVILGFVSNLDNDYDAKKFVELYFLAIDNIQSSIGEEMPDKKKIMEFVAETDSRFKDYLIED